MRSLIHLPIDERDEGVGFNPHSPTRDYAGYLRELDKKMEAATIFRVQGLGLVGGLQPLRTNIPPLHSGTIFGAFLVRVRGLSIGRGRDLTSIRACSNDSPNSENICLAPNYAQRLSFSGSLKTAPTFDEGLQCSAPP